MGSRIEGGKPGTSPEQVAPEQDEDYGGMPLDEWIEGTQKHLRENFGDMPDDLVPLGEPGW